jgi:lipid-A-disaccharide synthase
VAKNNSNKVLIVAGESSGDLHGGNLAAEIKRLRPGIELSGIGGSWMRKAGVDTFVDISRLAVVGIWEVLAHFKDIKGAFDKAKEALYNAPPALIVLIDYPDFNLRLAKVAKKAGVPVVYYVSPQLWAWRRGRIKTMAKLVRKMLVVFPFEEKIYKEAGMDCTFVGHPLLDTVHELPGREVLAGRYGLDPGRPILGLLPGSRKKELSYHLPSMLKAYGILKEKLPGLQVIIPVASTLGLDDFGPYMEGYKEARLVEHDTEGVMALMDTAIVASGTATLQTALYKKPMVIIYKLSPMTYHIGKRLISVKYIGMVNLIAGEEVAPELIQDAATPENMSSLIFKMFCDKDYYGEVVEKLGRVCEKLGGPGASARAAEEVVKLVG